MKDLEYLLPELKEHYENCNELFDIAWELNKSDYTRTAFSQMVNSYMVGMMQTLGHIIGKIEGNDNSKHGEWLLESDEDMPDPMFKLLVCSVCNLKANSPYKYCPNCGTKMTSQNDLKNPKPKHRGRKADICIVDEFLDYDMEK